MEKENKQKQIIMAIVFLLATIIIAFGHRFLDNTANSIARIISYLYVVYFFYDSKDMNKKLRILFIICNSIILIGEIGSFISG